MDLRERAIIPPYVMTQNINNSLGSGIEIEAEEYA